MASSLYGDVKRRDQRSVFIRCRERGRGQEQDRRVGGSRDQGEHTGVAQTRLP